MVGRIEGIEAEEIKDGYKDALPKEKLKGSQREVRGKSEGSQREDAPLQCRRMSRNDKHLPGICGIPSGTERWSTEM